MTPDEELLTSNLRMLGGGLDDAELDRRVSRFQGALRQLRDDPAEAARIDAIVMDAELAQPDAEALSGRGDIYVSGGNVTITPGYPAEAADAKDRFDAALASLDQQLQELAELQESLKEEPTRTRPQPGPRRIWETLLRPAFGGGILVAVLGIATVTAAIHASAATMSIIGIILAAATAITALLSVLVPWTSVHALNRRGDAYSALELLYGRNRAREPEHAGNLDLAASRRRPTGLSPRYPGAKENEGPIQTDYAELDEQYQLAKRKLDEEFVATRLRVERERLKAWEAVEIKRIAAEQARDTP